MATPILYQAKTCKGHENQRIFEIPKRLQDYGKIAMSHSQSMYDEKTKNTLVPVKRRTILVTESGMEERFNLLDFERIPLKRKQGYTHFVDVEYAIECALDPELQQLFEFLKYHERQLHKQQIADMQRHIDHWMTCNDKNLNLFANAEKEKSVLLTEIAQLKRPWYIKFYEFLFRGIVN